VAEKILITGGAGFIGSNLASHFLSQGKKVIVFDNLSRRGSAKNLFWLEQQKGDLEVIVKDIRNLAALAHAIAKADAIFHLAAQTAVTTSLRNPKEDFEINAQGTLNVLEAVRAEKRKIPVVFSSTNKVYGTLPGLSVVRNSSRYEFSNLRLRVSESQPVDFHSPYGCSKGVADQYVCDYHRFYGLPTVVFRQSCIYGPRQFGVEDQGWVAHFVLSAILGKPITIYGDGYQVRDLLYIDDLISAFDNALAKIDKVSGEVYNIGGGPKNTISVWTEFSKLLGKINGDLPKITYEKERPGDQRVYISDISKAKRDLGWQPKVPVKEGIKRLILWVSQNRELFG
jgi:CDP-paratose 2-epimerase